MRIFQDDDGAEYVGGLTSAVQEAARTVCSPIPSANFEKLKEWLVSECTNCQGLTIWHSSALVYPEAILIEEPNGDMPEKVSDIYLEAAQVFVKSPRASAALLRLALQMILKDILGSKSTGKIFSDIAMLGDRGIRSQIIKVMDILRYNGNESVHPGEIDLSDNKDDALLLFALLNMIAEEFYTMDARLNELYERMPEQKRVELR